MDANEHAGKNLSAYIEGAPVITVGNDMREIEENMNSYGMKVKLLAALETKFVGVDDAILDRMATLQLPSHKTINRVQFISVKRS